ncbi:MAG: hypothetical protein Q8Q59_15805 [Luteolibacter sp.]|nr:hypothetical protein [Luteolibacter sp.]
MKTTRVKQILEAAAKLPPAKGRALVAAISAKEEPVREDPLSDAARMMEAAMIEAAFKALEESPN